MNIDNQRLILEGLMGIDKEETDHILKRISPFRNKHENPHAFRSGKAVLTGSKLPESWSFDFQSLGNPEIILPGDYPDEIDKLDEKIERIKRQEEDVKKNPDDEFKEHKLDMLYFEKQITERKRLSKVIDKQIQAERQWEEEKSKERKLNRKERRKIGRF